jgi:TraM recognition site of TraD and TraG
VAAGGLLVGCLVSAAGNARLTGDAGYITLAKQSRAAATYLRLFVLLPFPPALALLGVALATYAEVRGWISRNPGLDVPLPPYPFDATEMKLVLGEVHGTDGSRSACPRFLCLPEKGMYGGIFVCGATGSSKTKGAHNPYLAQLIRLRADDPARKLAGLVIDAKGTDSDFVLEQCRMAGREPDYHEISLRSGIRYNPLARPDLSAPALGGHIGDVIANYEGQSVNDPFWREAAKDLATKVIQLIRLAEGREPTMVDLYKVSTSPDLFKAWLDAAEARVKSGHGDKRELTSVRFWFDAKLAAMDPRLRGSIAAGLNGLCALFDVPEIERVFCPPAGEENFRGFHEALAKGLVVSLRVPRSDLKNVAEVVATLTKLNFQDAVLGRLSSGAEAPAEARPVFFVADEYDAIITQPADGIYLSKCREARACNVILTQSHESIVAKLRNEHVAEQLLGQLRTKIWLCAEDHYTARKAADLCGEVERPKESHARSESLRQGAYSYLDGKIVSGGPADVGESRTISLRREHRFNTWSFLSLRVNQAIAKVFDGIRVLEPTYLYLKPIFGDPNRSWFETPADEGGGLE